MSIEVETFSLIPCVCKSVTDFNVSLRCVSHKFVVHEDDVLRESFFIIDSFGDLCIMLSALRVWSIALTLSLCVALITENEPRSVESHAGCVNYMSTW